MGDNDDGSGGRWTAAPAGGANKYGRGRLWECRCYPLSMIAEREGGRQYWPGGGQCCISRIAIFPSFVGEAREIGESS